MEDLVRVIKGWEKEFLGQNVELYNADRIEFLRKREAFVTEKLGNRRSNGEE